MMDYWDMRRGVVATEWFLLLKCYEIFITKLPSNCPTMTRRWTSHGKSFKNIVGTIMRTMQCVTRNGAVECQTKWGLLRLGPLAVLTNLKAGYSTTSHGGKALWTYTTTAREEMLRGNIGS